MSFKKDQLLPGESLIALTREHKVVLLRPVLINIIAVAVLVALALSVRQYWLMILYVVPALYLLWEILVWRSKEYVVTDHRVVKQDGVFSISSFDASLDKINNVFHEQSLMGRLLKYGTVGLETASEQGTTVFEFIPRPVDFKGKIVRQREMYRSVAGIGAGNPKQDIPRMIEDLASLRDRGIITSQEFEEKKRALLQKI
ncbi:MAG TPA: PH domain-containing protein [Acidobacteriota bacterium]|nr:PH domain-containing protein [Acidobacteriota bacterium]